MTEAVEPVEMSAPDAEPVEPMTTAPESDWAPAGVASAARTVRAA